MTRLDTVSEMRAKHDAWKARIDATLNGFTERYQAEYGTAECIALKRVDEKTGRWAGRIIHPSTRLPGHWQSTLFHDTGFFSHDSHVTLEDALYEDIRSGFEAADPAWADEVLMSDYFLTSELRAQRALAEFYAEQAARRAAREGETT